MIVDDSELDRTLLANVLTKKGYEVTTLESSATCFDSVVTQKPDAVLLDILMPEIDGKQVLHMLRKKFNSIELPIIMMTAKSATSDVIESLQLGANDYITKPADFDVALMRIETHLKISELSQQMFRLKELEAVGAMVVTYNHEINNPLAIALGALKKMEKNPNENNYKKLEDAIWKISNIVKKIEEATRKVKIEYENYAGKLTKMVKVR